MTLMKVDQSNLFPGVSNIWEDFFGRDITDLPSWRTGSSIPAVNIEEHPDKFLVCLAAPGIERDDFKIEVEQGVLIISSEKKDRHEEKTDKFTRREFSYQSFKRSFTLPETIKVDQIDAKYENGILTVDLPKVEEAKVKPTRQITIK